MNNSLVCKIHGLCRNKNLNWFLTEIPIFVIFGIINHPICSIILRSYLRNLRMVFCNFFQPLSYSVVSSLYRFCLAATLVFQSKYCMDSEGVLDFRGFHLIQHAQVEGQIPYCSFHSVLNKIFIDIGSYTWMFLKNLKNGDNRIRGILENEGFL